MGKIHTPRVHQELNTLRFQPYRSPGATGQESGTRENPIELDEDESDIYLGHCLSMSCPEDDVPGHKAEDSFVDNPMIKRNSLNELLQGKQRIVFFTGAGISTSAGVDDFRSRSRTKQSSQKQFDVSMMTSEELNSRIGSILQDCSRMMPTHFHKFMDRLAKDGRVQRHYTQNIDCLETRTACLEHRTVWLHGRADMVICRQCHYTIDICSAQFKGIVGSHCTRCKETSAKRTAKGKRALSIGCLWPKVLLYGEFSSPDDTAISSMYNEDRAEHVDAVVIAGTRLKSSGARDLARSFCRTVKARGGIIIWVCREPPRLGKDFNALLNEILVGDCDEFAW